MDGKQRISNGLLLALLIFENLFLYYFYKNGILSTGKNAIGLFISSLLFGLVVIYKFYNRPVIETTSRETSKKIPAYIALAILCCGLVVLGSQYGSFFPAHKIDHTTSDIIPQIQILCRRFLTGKYPYSIFGDFGFDQQPTYLPMQWLPFTITDLLHTDYRWVCYTVWCAAAIWLGIRSIKASSAVFAAMAPLLILGAYYVLHINNIGILEVTIELLIAAYYMMLMMSLNSDNGILQGTFIGICLLSRYSLVLWLPLYFFVLFLAGHRKQLYLSITTASALVLVLYVIPFMSKDWGIFYKGYKYYEGATYFEWTHLNKDGQPLHLFNGTGFAYYFYTRFSALDIMARVKLLQRAQQAGCIMASLGMGVWFWYKKEKINEHIFLMASFKIYLAIFLFLIQIPYTYLMCVGNFVSLAILCEQARYRLSAAQRQ